MKPIAIKRNKKLNLTEATIANDGPIIHPIPSQASLSSSTSNNSSQSECNCNRVKELEHKLLAYENIVLTEKKTYQTSTMFINDQGQVIPLTTTRIHCWNDGCPINGYPFYLPNGRDKTKTRYLAFGWFCSPNCALTYNVKILDDDKTMLRTNLVYEIYRKMLDIADDVVFTINMALPFELIDVFGGPMTIQEYRMACCTNEQFFKVYYPSIVPNEVYIEEVKKSAFLKNKKTVATLAGGNTSNGSTSGKPVATEKKKITFLTMKKKPN
ncbi:Hypothetical protein MVR_LOCUS239 [uncultured virus]|nr:Hypothetical protein MVR_LOCUS239 [uncultured virus]